MPYRRKKKRTKKLVRKRFRRYRKPRNVFMNNTNTVTVKLRMTGYINQTNAFQTAGITFKLQDFNAYGKWSEIFEQFRMVKITQKIYPTCDSFMAPSKIAQSLADDDEQITQVYTPLLLYKIDRDDVDEPNDLDDCLKNPMFKVRNMKKPQTISFKPNVLANIYQGAVTNNYAIKYNQWLDTNDSSDCAHFGLVRCLHCQGCSSTYPMTYRIITECLVQFKGMKLDET